MAFFSTAANSPKPGDAARISNQREGLRQREAETQQIADERAKRYIDKRNQEMRRDELSKSLLALPKMDKENVTAWALANSVNAEELTAMEPILKARKETIDKTKSYGAVKEDPIGFYQEDEATGLRTYHKKKKGTSTGQTFTTYEDKIGEYQLNDATGKKTYTHKNTTGAAKTDKVAPWYTAMKQETKFLYIGDNMEPTDVQRDNYNRAMLRGSTRLEKTSNELGISKTEALPYVMQQQRKDRQMVQDTTANLPTIERGMFSIKSSMADTAAEVRELSKSQMPTPLIGEALAEKGWAPQEVADILKAAAVTITLKDSELSPLKLQGTNLQIGEGFIDDKGVMWTKMNGYLEAEDGRRVRL